MRVHIITGAIFALAIAASPALACTGSEIFSDDFSDPAVSADIWGAADFVSVARGYLEIKMKPKFTGYVKVPNGEKEFDLCADITIPQAQKPDGGTWGGFMFWFKDWDNHYWLATTPVGLAALARVTKGRNLWLSPPKVHDAIKKGAGAKNTFRLTLKGNAGTVYGNNQRLFSFRAVAADAEDMVGLAANSGDDQEVGWRFSNVKLTEPPK